MIWLTWRQFRTQFIAVFGLWRQPASGSPSPARRWLGSPTDNKDVYDLLTRTDRLLFNGGIAVLAVAPAVIGIFWGAPLVARELETGTYRLAWNQSVTRSRWLAAKLGFSVLAAAVAVGILTTGDHVVGTPDRRRHWAASAGACPRDSRRSRSPCAASSRSPTPSSHLSWAPSSGWSSAVAARDGPDPGDLRLRPDRRAVVGPPAPGPADHDLDGHLAGHARRHQRRRRRHRYHHHPRDTPATGSCPTRPSTPDGKAAALPVLVQRLSPPTAGAGQPSRRREVQSEPGTLDPCLTRLTDEGYRQRLVYQPHDHFWPLQWAETGLYLAARRCSPGSRSGGPAAGCPDCTQDLGWPEP